jgi:hypothetical protein
MTDPQPSQQAEVPTPERSSDEPHRPVRSQAPSGPPPLDSRARGAPKACRRSPQGRMARRRRRNRGCGSSG